MSEMQEFEGLPVYVHDFLEFGFAKDANGAMVDRYIDVSLNGDRASVTAIMRPDICRYIGKAASVADAAALYPQAVAALAAIAPDEIEYRRLVSQYGSGKGAISRAEYETIAAECGFEPRADSDLGDYGDEYGSFGWPQYALTDLPRLWSAQRRWSAIKREREAIQEAEQKSRATREAEVIEALREQPVSRTEMHLVPIGTPAEFLRHGVLYTVIDRVPHAAITEDDPAVHGEHLLGHEGEPAEVVTVEVRR